MKSKLIYSDYDKPSGISTVVVSNKYGVFEGRAVLHPEDKKYESSFFGCRIAEARCTIATLKEQRQQLKVQIKTLTDFEKNLKGQRQYNPHSFECRKLRKQIYILTLEKGNIEKRIEEIAENIKTVDKNRQKSINQLIKAQDDLDKRK